MSMIPRLMGPSPPCPQLNIFLAILIEGYDSVKRGASESQGMPAELKAIASHEMRRLCTLVREDFPFISDDSLAAELRQRVQRLPVSANRALKDYAGIGLGNWLKVCL